MRRAFTLIELLVVIAIIALLGGMVLVAANNLRHKARVLQTTTRMEAVTQGLSRLGAAGTGKTAAEILHRGIFAPALLAAGHRTGVLHFESSQLERVRYAVRPTLGPSGEILALTKVVDPELDGNWFLPGAGRPAWCLPYPWGRPSLVAGSPDASGPPAPLNLKQLQPAQTVALLAAAGFEVDASSWGVDTRTGSAWNDGWGHPLVVAWALYQPLAEEYDSAAQAYSDTRSAFVAVAAAGPELPPGWTPAVGPQAIWDWATGICCDGDAGVSDLDWDQDSFGAQPWKNIKEGRRVGQRAYLGAPVEIK